MAKGLIKHVGLWWLMSGCGGTCLAVVARVFNPSTREAESSGSLSLVSALLSIVSSRPGRATKRDPIFKKTYPSPHDLGTHFDQFE